MAGAILAGANALGWGIVLARFAKQLIVGLGITAVTTIGVSAAVGWIEGAISGWFNNLPSTVLGVINYCEVPKGLSLIFGAYAGGYATGNFRRVVLKAATS